MLVNHKSPASIEAELLMSRSMHKGSFLLVEGPSDSRFWTARVNRNQCELVLAGGKPNLTGAMDRLDRKGFFGALGVVDDDFDSLMGKVSVSANIAVTDNHDLECMLLRSPALEKLLAELGNSAKISWFESSQNISVREALLQRGLAFGKLRWLSCREGWNLPFEVELKPAKFVHEDAWIVDEAKLLECAVAVGAPQELPQLLAGLPDADPWLVCQGHDLITILRIGLRKLLGDLKSHFDVDAVAGVLRAAYETPSLMATGLYTGVRQWEHSNSPYLIIA